MEIKHYAEVDDPRRIHSGYMSVTGDLVYLVCGVSRFRVVPHHIGAVPEHTTPAPATCWECLALDGIGHDHPLHPLGIAKANAAAVLARAEERGYVPEPDDEGLRLTLGHPVTTGTPPPLYRLIRELLAEEMTARALTPPAPGTPKVMVRYTRFTGGAVQAPLGAGDHVMNSDVASGSLGETAMVTAIEHTTLYGVEGVWVTVAKGNSLRHLTAKQISRHYLKLDKDPRRERAT